MAISQSVCLSVCLLSPSGRSTQPVGRYTCIWGACQERRASRPNSSQTQALSRRSWASRLDTEDVYSVGMAAAGQDSRPGWGSEARRFPELNPATEARFQEWRKQEIGLWGIPEIREGLVGTLETASLLEHGKGVPEGQCSSGEGLQRRLRNNCHWPLILRK